MSGIVASEDWREMLVAYARFNAGRSLGTVRDSLFTRDLVDGVERFRDAHRPGWPCNRIFPEHPLVDTQLTKLQDSYAELGVSMFVEIGDEACSPEMREAMDSLGLQRLWELQYLAQDLRSEEGIETSNEVEVVRWGPDRRDDFRELLGTSGVRCEDEIWTLRREQYCTDRFRIYVAFSEGEPCAWGTLFHDGARGYLANAYTQEGFRNRGCQSTLLDARLRDARKLGLSWVGTDVEVGTGSERNCRRAGFVSQERVSIWSVPGNP